MRKNWLLIVSLAVVLVMAGLVGCSRGGEVLGTVSLNNQHEGIWVTGKGEMSVVPDVVTLSLGIEAQAVSVVEAQSQAADAMGDVMASLTDNSVAESDIQTRHFSISQVTKWDKNRGDEIVIGYRVTNMVTAKIRDIDKAPSIIDAVAQAGGDLTRIGSIAFSVDDPSVYYEEVREEAMNDAKAKAEQMAELAGVTLGKPTYISESIQFPPIIWDYAREAAPAVETPISPGETEIGLTVQVAYAILK
jgi:uncharacterized protein YggE